MEWTREFREAEKIKSNHHTHTTQILWTFWCISSWAFKNRKHIPIDVEAVSHGSYSTGFWWPLTGCVTLVKSLSFSGPSAHHKIGITLHTHRFIVQIKGENTFQVSAAQ